MAVKTSRLLDKSFKKKFKECIIQLKKMLSETGIASKQKQLLSYIEEARDSFSAFSNENTSNVREKNVWGQKDLMTVLGERNERIFNLENELADLRTANTRVDDDRKRMKVESVAQKTADEYKKIVKEKNRIIASLEQEMDDLKEKSRSNEMVNSREKNALEMLRETTRVQTEILNKKSSPLPHREFTTSQYKQGGIDEDVMKNRQRIADLEEKLEFMKEQEKMHVEREAMLRRMLEDNEASRIVQKNGGQSDDVPMNDVDTALMEELENITTAYDRVMATNVELESQLAAMQKKDSELQAENLCLRGKAKNFEETKAVVEKERRRLSEWKEALRTETKQFEERVESSEHRFIEKDKKIAEYKVLLSSLQAEVNILKEEMNGHSIQYSMVQCEYSEVKNELRALKIAHGDLKKISEAYKEMCVSDTSIVEDFERYKKVLRCSLCDLNLKNTVILKCMHTFCDGCVQDRLKARQRKCPTCQVDFNMNDVKKIYI